MSHRLFLLLVVGAWLTGCDPRAPLSVCNTYEHPEEASTIGRELAKRKIIHRVDGKTLCHRNGEAEHVAVARNAAYEYYRAVATVIRDSETEKRLTTVLDQDKKLYSVVSTENGARLLILHSLSPDEVMNNQSYLSRIQRKD